MRDCSDFRRCCFIYACKVWISSRWLDSANDASRCTPPPCIARLAASCLLRLATRACHIRPLPHVGSTSASLLAAVSRAHSVSLSLPPDHADFIRALQPKASSFKRITRLQVDQARKQWSEAQVLELLQQPWMQTTSAVVGLRADMVWLQSQVQSAICRLPHLTHLSFSSRVAGVTSAMSAAAVAEAPRPLTLLSRVDLDLVEDESDAAVSVCAGSWSF